MAAGRSFLHIVGNRIGSTQWSCYFQVIRSRTWSASRYLNSSKQLSWPLLRELLKRGKLLSSVKLVWSNFPFQGYRKNLCFGGNRLISLRGALIIDAKKQHPGVRNCPNRFVLFAAHFCQTHLATPVIADQKKVQ
jgi:hypothetical protein